MKNMRRMTKADKLRRASTVAWLISTGLTAFWVYHIVAAQGLGFIATLALTLVISGGVQYVLSLIESALFDGSLPTPWSPDWTWEGSPPWLWAGALACLLIDVALNLGGVAIFTNKLAATNIGQNQLAVSDEFVTGVSKFAGFALAVLFAVSSELLDEFAVYAETGGSKALANRAQRVKESIRQNNELEALLNGRKDQAFPGNNKQQQKPQKSEKTPEPTPEDDLAIAR